MNILTSNSSFNVSTLVQSKRVESKELPNFFGKNDVRKQGQVEGNHDIKNQKLKKDSK